jgi:hypothetical protein
VNRVSFSLAIGALAAAVLGSFAAAAKPVHIPLPDPDVRIDSAVKPRVLSRTNPTPIVFSLSGNIRSISGSHPPALHELILESDKNIAIDVKEVPTCRSNGLVPPDPASAKAACKPAIVGHGHLAAQIALPGTTAVPAQSMLTVINGGFEGGVTTLFIRAYITIPVPAEIVTTVKIKKIRKGRYGLLWVATIPKIAGGSGSITQFNLTINRPGVLTAKCTDGKLQVHGKAVFTGGPVAAATVRRRCTPKP